MKKHDFETVKSHADLQLGYFIAGKPGVNTISFEITLEGVTYKVTYELEITNDRPIWNLTKCVSLEK